YTIVEADQPADIFILNTCTVTSIADRKSRQMLRRAHRINPGAQVIATGCYAQRAPGDLQRMPEVAMVVGNAEKMRLADLLAETKKTPRSYPVPPGERGAISASSQEAGARPYTNGRTRAFVKIQEGCNQVCAYCIVPKTRGLERSMPMERLIAQVKERVSEGYREVVLTGTQLGSYGFESGPNPADIPWYETLIRRILDETAIERLRMSSLQPQEISPGLIELCAQGRLCPHVHMPLQAGSNGVLKRMRRRYDTATYAKAVEQLRSAVPDIAITTDIIVGFPGESDTAFEESLRFAAAMGFAAMHVFPYSKRPGTSAAFLPGQVADDVKAARELRMLKVADEAREAYRQGMVGKRVRVLWEGKATGSGARIWRGHSENYVDVRTRNARTLANQVTEARITSADDDGLWCELGEV
ncbi:MAG: tRNA (N(6)-L-threonylcarbamoyladenosine(37)-C(2))-methylthiotransferase MtaB, partial [Chloroflexi bacterium]|nr:tRNA (N(6)-L-threonylcarbamoyladenosine(37)-C(2))-methylthiotransferase MtaB [Chloroflexota bacterium]